ncbi:MAG: tRNA (adenosine(37)-N6)-dimethylallyltransferase MiaA [Parvibaculum sp.]
MSDARRKGLTPDVVLIAGPTASGKSALGLALASRLGGEIVNADSMQIYQELRVLTARPSVEEEVEAPHHLYGHVSGGTLYSTGQWLQDSLEAIADVRARGLVPIVLGGTGLYFQALTEGFVDIPPIPDDVRRLVRSEVADIGPQAAHGLLRAVDPKWAGQVNENDPQRISRGLEVFRATGRALTDWHEDPVDVPLRGRAVKFVLAPDRAWLYERINRRFDLMLEAGALDEVKALLSFGFADHLPVMKSLGVPELQVHLQGEISLEEARIRAQTKSRQYAKRQMTWFRQRMIAWNTIFAQDLESQIDEIFSFIDDYGLTDTV